MLSIGGDRPPEAGAPISRARLETMGRVALRTVTALDAAPRGRPVSPEASSRDLATSRKVLPGWAVRRASDPGLHCLGWAGGWALPVVLAALLAIALGAVGLLDATPGAPVSPEALPPQVPALLAVALVLVLGWVWLRPALLRLTHASARPSTPAAGVMVVLVTLFAAIAVWIRNPYAALALMPALHVWLFALAPEIRMRVPLRIGLVAAGILPVALLAAAVAHSLGLGVLDAVWQALLVVAGGHMSVIAVVLWSLLAGCAAAALLIAAQAGAPQVDPDAPITVRGPQGYAGPGSLGGTESALRR
jgi:hypothetical protein